MSRTLEFWPEYGDRLLWDERGRVVALESLPIPARLQEAAARWLSEYDDTKLPWERTADEEWMARGRALLRDLRAALRPHGIALQPDEDFWELDQPGP